MKHFHVIRWGEIQTSSGESIAVTDSDFAAVADPQEAESLVSRVASLGDRCVSVVCQEAICTLHPARFAV